MQWINILEASIFISRSEEQHYFYEPVSQVSKKLSTYKWTGLGCGGINHPSPEFVTKFMPGLISEI